MEREVDVSAVVRAASARVRDVIIDDPGCVLSERCSAEDRRSRRFVAELTADFGSGASLHQEILIQPGAPQLIDNVLLMPMRWHATGRERLFPAFEGELEVSAEKPGTRIRLTGSYKVPLGPLGQVGEGVGGHRVATQSLARYVEEIARRARVEVDRRITSVSPHRDHESPRDRSEHYIG